MTDIDIEIIERDNNIPPEKSILANKWKICMSKEAREEFRRILKECQDMNGDNAFDILTRFICDNLEEQ